MRKEEFFEILNDIDEDMTEGSRSSAKKKINHKVLGVYAACMCMAAVCIAAACIIILKPFGHADFNSMINKASVDTMAVLTALPIDGFMAHYLQTDFPKNSLSEYVGNEYLKTDSAIWYTPKDINNIKYLIRKDADGSLSLWRFSFFATEEKGFYTYGDVLSVIYKIKSADDIADITTIPFNADNTPDFFAIYDTIGTNTYNIREDIAKIYDILKNTICYGNDGENPADNTRFSYTFSDRNVVLPTSREIAYGTRCISIRLNDGTVCDGIIYNALSGSFFEYGGIFTEPLAEDEVYELNGILGIK